VFVLAVNRDQLSKSLQGVYGPSFNGSHYLKRFIDLDYQLKIPDRDAYIRASINNPALQRSFSARRKETDLTKIIVETLSWFSARFDYKLRDIDQLVIRFKLVLKCIPNQHEMDIFVLLVFIVLRQENEKLYQQFVDDMSFINEVIYFLLGESIETVSFPNHFGSVTGWLFQSGYDDFDIFDPEPLLVEWQKQHDEIPNEDKRKRELDRLLRLARYNGNGRQRSGVRKTAFKRIELINRIDINQS
jgi:hypothetical protein